MGGMPCQHSLEAVEHCVSDLHNKRQLALALWVSPTHLYGLNGFEDILGGLGPALSLDRDESALDDYVEEFFSGSI